MMKATTNRVETQRELEARNRRARKLIRTGILDIAMTFIGYKSLVTWAGVESWIPIIVNFVCAVILCIQLDTLEDWQHQSNGWALTKLVAFFALFCNGMCALLSLGAIPIMGG